MRLNKKLDNYVSWQPDPKAVAVDAFSLNWATQSFYAFPPFNLLTKIVQKGPGGSGRGDINCTMVAHTAVVPSGHADVGGSTKDFTSYATLSTSQSGQSASTTLKTQITGMSLIWQSLQSQGVSKQASNIIIKLWRSGTIQQYQTYLNKWAIFCGERQVNPICPSLTEVLDFLTALFDEGIQYSGLNTARSALSSVVKLEGNMPVGQHPLVCRFLKGVFQERPALPRYNTTWDVSEVLSYLQTLDPSAKLSLKVLSQKLVVLLALLSGQRTQTLKLVHINNIRCTEAGCLIYVTSVLKHTRPGVHQEPIKLLSYPAHSRLCVVDALSTYLEKTKSL